MGDQFLDSPDDISALFSADTVNWDETEYGNLNADEWELDDVETARLMKEWTRSILDPVMVNYMNKKLPFCPEMPMQKIIFDNRMSSDDEEEKEQIIDDDDDDEVKVEKEKQTKTKK